MHLHRFFLFAGDDGSKDSIQQPGGLLGDGALPIATIMYRASYSLCKGRRGSHCEISDLFSAEAYSKILVDVYNRKRFLSLK